MNSLLFHSVEIIFAEFILTSSILDPKLNLFIYLASPDSGMDTAATWVIYCRPLINTSPYETGSQKGEGSDRAQEP